MVKRVTVMLKLNIRENNCHVALNNVKVKGMSTVSIFNSVA